MKQLEAPRKCPASKQTCCDISKRQSPQFQFWHLVLSVERVMLLLIRSFREANFILYRHSLAELIPYFFANNNVNYEPWLPIHLRDLLTLEEKHPQVAQEFCSGKFVVHKSCNGHRPWAHEQANGCQSSRLTGEQLAHHWWSINTEKMDGSWPWSQPLSSTV